MGVRVSGVLGSGRSARFIRGGGFVIRTPAQEIHWFGSGRAGGNR